MPPPAPQVPGAHRLGRRDGRYPRARPPLPSLRRRRAPRAGRDRPRPPRRPRRLRPDRDHVLPRSVRGPRLPRRRRARARLGRLLPRRPRPPRLRPTAADAPSLSDAPRVRTYRGLTQRERLFVRHLVDVVGGGPLDPARALRRAGASWGGGAAGEAIVRRLGDARRRVAGGARYHWLRCFRRVSAAPPPAASA